jgi:isopentenyl diphosphate isomerase/L-lactate dehydrogenase-like FMN-dependent dehydrogenase
MSLKRCFNIEDLRQQARRRLPRGLFEFIDRATEDDLAVARNRRGLAALRLAPRMMVDVSRRSTRATLLGCDSAMPLAVAPAGPAGFFWHRGELALARAAARVGVPFTLSTYSTTPIEDIVASGATVWLQLYLWRERGLSWAIAQRAWDLGVRVLLLTLDTPVLGQREYLHRNGFLPPFQASPRALADMALHPRWLCGVPLRYLAAGAWPSVVNIPAGGDAARRAEIARQTTLAQDMSWDDVAQLRRRWPGRLVLKGVLRCDDARRAAALGCDALVVSNHGGRNLDSALSPVEALPAIADAVGDRLEILMDSGVRRGSDIVKALALGARGVLAGRAPLYGVATAGEDGAAHALELLRSELDRTMALAGCAGVSDIGRDLVAPPAAFDEVPA